jgi:hypothetical protein
MLAPMRASHLLAMATTGLLLACPMDTVPAGLRATPTGPGARVVFDLTRRPLPELPLPNDVATFADPTSRTGLRPNISLVAPTHMERVARAGLSSLEGWGTYAPITVAFSKSETASPADPAIDLDRVRALMPKGNFEPSDDPFYVIDLKTGVPVVLDMGSGAQPAVMRSPENYFPNDPHVSDSNLYYETREEGAGLLQGDYRPELDTDFDGVLDHPNTLGHAGIDGYDNLLTWYERETDTLILRPLVPLEEKTEYAVVLTDRLVGSDGNPVRSPFPFVYHPEQVAAAERVREVLSDGSRANYYGSIAGTGLDHVAFLWSFTTQPVQEDLRLLRDGLYGKGPFSRFASEFPAKMTIHQAAGTASNADVQPPGWQNDPSCTTAAKKPYVYNLGDPQVLSQFAAILTQVGGGSSRDTNAIIESLSHVDHVVIGTYSSPYLIGDPHDEHPDDMFQLNFKTGEGQVTTDSVHFWLVVPKETATHKQPFPIDIMGHGYGGNSENVMSLGGELARQGVAAVMIDMPHHGLALTTGQQALVRGAFQPDCYAPFADAVLMGRAEDLNGDGVVDSGWWWWTSHLFHVRDNVRQGILDSMQLSRILASFDGKAMSDQDFNGDGKPELAGDFDANGVPDVGAPITAAGGSLGGIMSQIQGGVDHQIQATAPVVGGGGLTDVGVRSYGVSTPVLEQAITPLVVSVLGSERPPGSNNARNTNCAADQRSVRFVLNDGRNSPEVEIACLNASELGPNMTVRLTNVTTGEVRCAGTTDDAGHFRVPIPASVGDAIDIQVFNAPNAVVSYGTCELEPNAPAGRHINKFEQQAPSYQPVESGSCDAPSGCAQFTDQFFPVGSTLVSPQEGLGLMRQTPLFRRFYFLGQAVLDAADPINFAPYYALRPQLDPDGNPVPPRPVLNTASVGDNYVPTATELAFGRAAGIVPFLPPDFAARFPEWAAYATPPSLYTEEGGRTADQVLVDTYTTEGIARLARFPAGPTCSANAISAPDCAKTISPTTCQQALFDVDWLSEGALPFAQQHLAEPLRLVRRADESVAGGASLDDVWAPRVAGQPFAATGWQGDAPLMGQLTMYSDPAGTHGPQGGPCTLWDPQMYSLGLLARFLATVGHDVLYVSRPSGHECLADHSCDFEQ